MRKVIPFYSPHVTIFMFHLTTKFVKDFDSLLGMFYLNKAKKKNTRPINMLVYILLLLAKGEKNPLLVDVLSLACVYDGNNFAQIQEHFFSIFLGNISLISLLLSDLRVRIIK